MNHHWKLRVSLEIVCICGMETISHTSGTNLVGNYPIFGRSESSKEIESIPLWIVCNSGMGTISHTPGRSGGRARKQIRGE